MDDQEKLGRITVTFSVTGSGFAAVDVERTVTLSVLDETLEAARTDLAIQLEHEYGTIRRLSGLLLRLAEWRRELRPELERLVEQKVKMRVDVEATSTELQVDFVGEYEAAEPIAMVHPVRFDITRDIPPASEVLARLEKEWQTLLRILALQRSSMESDSRETLRVPSPFLKSKAAEVADPASGEFPLEARPASAEEAKRFTERYLGKFRFPFELVQGELTYSFLPRVGIRGDDAIQLRVTLLIPASERSTLAKLGSKAVTVPLDEIYVQGEELSRRTQEGVLGLVQGLCRALAREQGLKGEVDVSRPR